MITDLKITKMFSIQVRHARIARKMSQQTLADDARVSRATISNMERSEPLFVPSFANVVRVAKVLNISLDDVVNLLA